MKGEQPTPSFTFRPFSCAFHVALFASVSLVSTSFAASVDAKKGELKDLQGRIETLRREMVAAKESKVSAADQLRATESAISDANRRLRQLGAEGTELRRNLADLDEQNRRLERQSAAQQSQLARLLNRQFVGGDADALKLLLAGQDPNQAARDRYFLTRLSVAKADLIQQLRAAAAEKQRLAAVARERQGQLAEIERRQQESRAQLLERKKQRQTVLAAVAERLRAQRREIGTLRRNEQRLTRLIEELGRGAQASKARPRVGAGGTPAAPRAEAHEPASLGGAFAALRGRLRLPVQGTIAGRFGSRREEGGGTWKGLFIRAAEGTEVKAVAAGAVVFADWLRGFGNLLIIDHGDDFLSVYGNNESLLATVGTSVRQGEPIATVGNTGGNPDSGLYFELRHRGEPFDPLKWAGGS